MNVWVLYHHHGAYEGCSAPFAVAGSVESAIELAGVSPEGWAQLVADPDTYVHLNESVRFSRIGVGR